MYCKPIFSLLSTIVDKAHRAYVLHFKSLYYKSRLGYCGRNVIIQPPSAYGPLKNIYMYDNTCVLHNLMFLSSTGKLIIKKGAGLSSNICIITGNHGRSVDATFRSVKGTDLSQDIEKDTIIEEEAWIGANAIICSGVTVGRGANVGAGSVLRNSVPPYSVVIGNPAKIVGFSFTPQEIVVHEKAFYPEEERLPLELLERNYNKYFISRIKEIKEFTRLSL